jgi:hypothetical protein
MPHRLEDADEDEHEEESRSIFVLYSLRTHQVVKMLSMPGLSSSFIPNEHFIGVFLFLIYIISQLILSISHAEHDHSSNFTHFIFDNIRHIAYRPRWLARCLSHPCAALRLLFATPFYLSILFILGIIYFKRNIFNGAIRFQQLFESKLRCIFRGIICRRQDLE